MNNSFQLWVLYALLLSLCATFSLQAQVSGVVFRDYNGNGTQDANEPFMPGVIVNAYDATNALCGTATTVGGDSAPNYSLSGCGTGAVRVEFVLPTDGPFVAEEVDFPSLSGTTYGTSVQFVNGNSTNVNFALHDPDDYNTGPADVMNFLPCYINGNPQGGNTAESFDWFIGYPNTNRGTTPSPMKKIGGSIIGSTWGVAYSKYADRVFTSAFIKRHSGLGVSGSGGIYMLEPTATSFNATPFYDLDANGHRTRAASTAPAYGNGSSFQLIGSDGIVFLGPVDPLSNQPEGMGVVGENGPAGRNLPAFAGDPNNDPAAFGQVGKVGLGGLEISDDGRFLFVMNLYTRSVFRLELDDVYNPTSVVSVTEISLPNTACNNGEIRPFALTYDRGKLWAGAVCSGENGGTRSDLSAFVYEMDSPNTGTAFNPSPVFSTSLDYAKGFARYSGSSNPQNSAFWNPWDDSQIQLFEGDQARFAEPLLSDLTFGNNGQLILNFFDRCGHLFGDLNRFPGSNGLFFVNAGGEILTAGRDPNTGAFQLETEVDVNQQEGATVSSNGITLTSVGNGDFTCSACSGPNFFERFNPIRWQFFTGDRARPGIDHFETALGSSAYLPGESKAHFTVYDPNNQAFSAGIHLMSLSTGSFRDAAVGEFYRVFSGGQDPTTFGKANGLGELEFSKSIAPLEIGNRVWLDTNEDGIQDPDEAGIPGVVVELWKDDGTGNFTQIATVTTAADGGYFFTSATGTSLPGITYGVDMLLPEMNYELRFPATTTVGPDVFSVTVADMGGTDPNADARDSDADNAGVISFTTAGVGANNHSYDVGYRMPVLVAVGNLVFMDANNNGTFESGTDMPIEDVTLELYMAGEVAGVDMPTATTTTSAAGYYYFDNLMPGGYFVYIPASNFTAGEPLDNKESFPGADAGDLVDNNDNGGDTPVNGGVSSNTFTLTPGGEPTGEDQMEYPGSLDDDDVNGTIDFTFRCVDDLGVTLTDPTDECIDGSDMSFTATPAPGAGATGVFTTTAGAGLTDNGDGTATLDVSIAGAGVYDVTYTYTTASGCEEAQTVSVTVNPEPVVTLNDPADECIDGADISFTGMPVPAGTATGVFTTTAGAGFTDNGDGTATLDVSAAGVGTYDVTYTYTDENGCDAAQTVSVTVNPEPVVTLNDPADECTGGTDMSFMGMPVPAGTATGVFTTTAGIGFTDNGDGTATLDVSVAGAGTYDVTYTYTDENGCDAAQTVSVEVYTEPTVTLNDPADVCIDGADMSFTGMPTDANGVFTTTVGAGFTDNGDGTASLDVSVAGAGTYDVTYTYTDVNGCDAAQTVSVTVNPEPVVTLNDPADECIDGADMSFTGMPTDANGVFTTTAGAGLTDNGDGTATLDVSIAGAGTYDVTYTYTDVNGCDAAQTVSVTVNPEPVVTLNDPADECIDGADMSFTGMPTDANGVFTTTAVAGFTDNGDGTASLDVSVAGAGTYDVTYTYTDVNGCDAAQTVSVTVNPEPVVTLNDPADVCIDGADMSFTGMPTDANGVFTTTAGAGFTDNGDGTASLDVSVAGAGTYDVTYTYTDVNGCDASETVSVTVNPEPVVTLNDPADECIDGADMSFMGMPVPAGTATGVFTTTAGAGFTDNGDGTASLDVSVAGAGTYDVTYTYTDENGCDASETVSVTVNPEPVVTLNDPADECIDGADMSFTGMPTDANGVFTTTAVAGFTDNGDGTASLDVSVAGAGTYDVTYTYTDVNGCDAAQTVSVTVNPEPVVTLNDPADVCIDGADMSFTGMPTDANGVFTTTAVAGFTDNGDGTASLDVSAAGAGTYDVTYTYTDVNGCDASETVSVAVNPEPVVTLNDPADECIDGADMSFMGMPVPAGTATGVFTTTAGAGFTDNGDGTASLDVSVAGAGTYDVTYTYTDENGCDASETVSVTVNPEPVVTLNDPADECIDGADMSFTGMPTDANGVFTTTAVAGFTDNGDGTASLDVSVAGAGTYDVTYTYTDVNGCDAAQTVSVTVNPEPVVTLNDPADVCIDGADMSFTGMPTDANGVFTTTAGAGFTDNGDGTASLDVSVAGAGTYDVTYTYTDVNGCDASETVSVTVNPEPVVTLNDPADVCIDGADMSFTGMPTDANGVFTTTVGAGFTDNGDGTASLDVSVAGAGTYDVTYTYTDVNGCDAAQTVSVTVNPEPVVTLNDPADECIDGADMSFTGMPTDANGVFTTTAGAGLTDNGDGTATLDVSIAGAGTYDVTYTYTDVNGCDAAQTVSVTVNPEPVVTLNDPADECIDGADMSFTGMPTDANGVFTTTAVAGFTDNGDGTASLDVSVAGAGTYDVTYTYTDVNGCDAAQTVSVTVNPEPVVTLNDPADVCIDGADMSFTGMPTDANGVFTTTADAGFTDNGDGTASLDVSVAGAGTYDVTYTYTDVNGCDASETVSVTVNPEPVVTLNDPADECIDGADMSFMGMPVPAGTATGVFTTTAGAGFTDNGDGTASLDVSVAGAGTYDVTYTYTDVNGCDASETVSVTVNPEPVVTLNDPADECIDGADMSFTGMPTDANGVFTTTAVAGFTDNGDGTASLDVSVAGAGTYEVTYTYTDVNGCDAAQTVSVTVNPEPVVTLNDPADVCIDGADMSFTGMPTDANGVFTTTAVAGFTDNGDGTASLDVSAAGAGTYDVTYTYTDVNGCDASETVSVAVNPEPVVTLNDPADECIDGADMSFMGMPVPAGTATGVFTTTAGAGFTDNGDGTASLDVSVAGAGTYDVTYTYTDVNGCDASETVSVTVNPEPVVTLNDPADECIDGADMSFTGMPTDANGVFTTTAGAGLTDNGDGTASLDVSVAGAGTYDVTYTYTDVNGCDAAQTVSVTVNPEPVVTLNDPADVCIDGADMSFTGMPTDANGVFTTTAGAGFTDNGDGTASLDVSVAGAGTYDVTYTYTDVNGCDAAQTVSVTVNPEPVVTLNDPADVCIDGADMSFTGMPTDANGVFTTTAVAGFTDNGDGTASLDVSVAGAGTYDVTYTYTDVNGCDAAQTVSVTVNPEPVVTLNDPADECIDGADMSFTGMPTDANGVFTTTAGAGFTDNGDGTASLDVSVAGAGTYDVTYTYTDVNGCDASETVSVTVNPEPIVTLNDPADVCIDGADMSFTGMPTDANGVFTTTAVAGFTDNGDGTASLDVSVAGAGTYDVTYTYTDVNGCDASETVSVTVNPEPIVTLNDPADVCIDGADMSFTGMPTDANGVFTTTAVAGFTDNGDGTASLDVSVAGAGTYDVTYTYTDVNGCDAAQTVSVTVTPEPVVTLNDPADECIDGADMSFTGMPTDANGVFTTTAGAGFTDNGDGTASLDVSVAGAGTYDVTYTYTDENGCDASQTVSVEVLEGAIANDAELALCDDGSGNATFDLTDAEDPTSASNIASGMGQDVDGGQMATVTYHTASPATLVNEIAMPTAYSASNGTMIVALVTAGNGCTNEAIVTLTVFELPSIAFTKVDDTDCLNPNMGSIDVTVSGGAGGYTYDWADLPGPDNMEDRSNLPAGDYSIVVTDANGCTATQLITIQAAECVSVGNYVFMDVNDNGTFESGIDMPIEDVIVELYAAGDEAGVDTPLATIMTSPTGYYYFDELNGGDYFVHIPTMNFAPGEPLENKESFPGSDPGDEVDGNDNGIDTPVAGGVSSNTFTLTPNGEPTGEDQTEYPGTLDDDNVNGTIDFTFVTEKVAVGNYVFMDVNDNGTFEAGTDMPLGSVAVELYAAGDAVGVDTPVASTMTSPTGYYYFDALEAGDYFVHIPASNFSAGEPLENKESFPGADPGDEVDGNDNGIDTPVIGGISSNTFTLTPNGEPTGEDQTEYPGTLDDDNVNGTIDFTFRTERADVSLIKIVDNPTPNVGETVTFTIMVSNDGPNDATDVAVEDVVPNGFSDITNISNGGMASGNVITWSALDIADGVSIDLTFDVTVEAPGTGVDYDNVAEVTAMDQFDPDSTPDNGPDPDGDGLVGPLDDNPNDQSVDTDGDDDDADNEPVTPQVADISLIKIVDNPTPNVGETVTFTITVSNDGPNDATGVAVEDIVPNGYSGITNISNGGTAAGNVITWSALDIANGGSIELTFDVTVEAPGIGVDYDNVAEVTAMDQFDPDSTPDNGPDPDNDGLVGPLDDNPNDQSVDTDGDDDDADNEPVLPMTADLNLVKTVNDAMPNVGDVVTFTITVSNEGPNDATGVAVEDIVPNGYSGIMNISSGGTVMDDTITWSDLSIANGGSLDLTFDVTVEAPGAGVDYVNLAEITGSDQFDEDSTPDNGPDTDGDGDIGSEDPDDNQDADDEDDGDDAVVEPMTADLNLVKTVNDAMPNVGDVVTFTITVSNEGPNDATGVAVEDIVPNGYSGIMNISNGGTVMDDTITWSDLSIANGGSLDLTFDVTVEAPGAGVDYVNLAEITGSDQFDEDSTPDNGPDTDGDGDIGSEDPDDNQDADDEDDGDDAVVEPMTADLNLVKTVNDAMPNVGDVVTFTITVSNEGPNDATGVAVEDIVPNGYSGIMNISNGGTVMDDTITWSDLSIANGGSLDLTFDVTVEAPGAGVDYVNLAEITGSDQFDEDSTPDNGPDTDGDGDIGSEDPDDNQDADDEDDGDDAVVEPMTVDLSLVKTVNDAMPNVGDVVTFTITVSNEGPNDATGVAVEDIVPNGYSGIMNISNGGTVMDDTITWSDLSIANGGSLDLTFDVTVEAPGAGVDYVNLAEITDSDQFDEDSTPDNGPDTDGDGDIGSEDPDDNQDADDEDDGDDAVVEPMTADLNLVKTVNDAMPNVGDVVTFTITVSNEGPNDATGVAVEDIVPNGYSGIMNISNGGTVMDDTITWSDLSIANGGSLDLTFDVTVEAPGAGVDYVNLAEITDSDQFDEDSTPDNGPDTDGDGDIGSEDPDDNQDADDEDDGDDAEVIPMAADVSLIKTVNNPTPNVGEVVIFTITLSNEGPNDATGVAVEDVVPNGYSGIMNISNGGTAMGNIITWDGLNITNGSSLDLTFEVTIEAPGEGVDFDNVAEVTEMDQDDLDSTPGNGSDPDGDGLIGSEDMNPNDGSIDPDDEDDADNEPVVPQLIDLSLIKVVSDATPNVGDVITFTITVSNAGPSDATGVEVEDVVPNGYSGIMNISNGGTATDNIIDWSGLSIANGASVDLTFEVTVEAPGTGVEYDNVAQVTDADQVDVDSTPDNGPDPDGDGLIGTEDMNPNDGSIDDDDDDDADNEPVTPQIADISLIKTVSDATPTVGEIITFTITVTNDGPNDASGVAIEDVVPNGFSGVMNVSNGGTVMGNIISWSGLSIANGASIELTFEVTVEAPGAGVNYNNVAEVTAADQFDPDSTPDNGPDPDGDGLIGTEDMNPNDGSIDDDDDDDADNEPVTPCILNIACISDINITLDESCGVEIIPEMVLTGEFLCADSIIISIDGGNNVISGCGSYIYTVLVLDNGVEVYDCWGTVNAEDKLSPVLVDSIVAPAELFCVELPEVNLNELPANVSRCFQVDAAGNVPVNFYNTALGSRLAAGSANGVIPTFFDGCSAMEICVNDLVPVTDLCDDVVITRVFTATDGIDCESVSGEENEPTVFSYEIIFTRPDVDEVMSEAGGAEFDCDEPLTLLPVNGFGDANPEPAFDDFPFITRADGSRVYLDDEGFCNLGATFEDGPRIVTCPQTYKFVRTWTVIDWCDVNNIETFTQLVKVGDFDAPMITAPTQDLDFNGVPDVGPLFYSANTSDCEAVFIIPAGSAMDACDPNPGVSVVVYPFQDTTALAFGPFAVGSPTLGGIPRGLHTLRYVATDACGNSSTLDVDLLIGDETAPVAICEDGLNLSIGGPIGPQGGMAQICAEDVDAASYDACSDIRRDIRITKVNGINVSPFSPLFAFEECKTLTCAQLGTIEVELRVTDDGNEDGIFDPQVDNVNSCWLNILVEDKTAPVCIAPAPQTVTCADLAQNFPQDLNVAFALDPVGTAALLDAQFGAATGLDNCPDPVVTQSVVDNRNSCGVGLITRTFVVTDGEGFMAPPGCTQTINVIGIHDYTVVFPGDQESDQCVEPDYNGVNFETFGCDLITVSTSVDTFTATAEECYKLRITYEVLNWCEYNTIDPAYEIPRDADGDGILDMDTTVLHVVPNADGLADDVAFLDRDVNRNNFNTIGNLDTGDGGILDGSDVGGYGVDGSRGAFTYEQFIKVYDDTPPTLVIPTPEDICSFDGVDCDADVELTWSIDDECSPTSVNSTVELDAFIDGGLDGIYTLAEFINDEDVTDAVTNNGDGTFTINLPNIPIGRHALRIRATDGCGNTAIDLLIFEVIDCKAPTPICINGLTVTLMPDGDGGGMAAIWVSDFIASPSEDCSGPVKFAIYLDEEVSGDPDFVPNPLDTGLVLTCDELGPQTIRIYAIDGMGQSDYCLTTLLVQAFNPGVCGPGSDASLSGAIMTPIDEMMNDVQVDISSDAGMTNATFTTGGLYSFADLTPGDDYTVEPTYNPTISLARVTTADIITISRHILGLQEITDTYQLLAADVTQEQTINIIDIIAIRRVILGLDAEFNNTNSWRFYATDELLENWTENNLDDNVIAPDFIAVEMGNVNQTAMSLSSGESEGRRYEDIVMEDVILLAGTSTTIEFNAKGQVNGFQGTLELLPGVEVIKVEAKENQQQVGFNLEQVASGLIAFSDATGEGFSITLRATADAHLSEVLSLSNRITTTEAYPVEGGVADLGMSFVNVTTVGSELFQNSPNPFEDETTISFTLFKAGTATLLVQNQNGQLLRTYEIDAIAGLNQQTITRQQIGTVSGMLTYTIIADGFTATRKMMIID